jgi:hypothetical protein
LVEGLDEFRLGVGRGVSNVVIAEDAEELRDGERGWLEIWLKIFAQGYHLRGS